MTVSEDISKVISGMLSNPDALKDLASNFSGGSMPQDTGSRGGELESSVKSMLSALNHTDDRRITLLTALKPYLSSSRAVEADKAIKLLRLTKISELLRNEGE